MSDELSAVQDKPKKTNRRKIEAVFDSPVVIEEMAAKITFLDNMNDNATEEDDFFAPQPSKRQTGAAIPDLPVKTGSFDGCSFSATQQASWRSAFSSICRMADEWLRHPDQKRTAMKSERIHAEFQDLVKGLHEKWVAMNKGGRWS